MPRDLMNYGSGQVWDFMSEVERAFDDFWRTPATATTAPRRISNFLPAVDVREGDDFYLLCVDVPGVPQKDIKIDVQNGRLTVSGERNQEQHRDEKMYSRFERSHGRFERSFQLPKDVDESKIQARCENGVLEIMVPKAEVAKPRSIRIESEKGGLFSRLLGQKKVENSSEKTESAPTIERH